MWLVECVETNQATDERLVSPSSDIVHILVVNQGSGGLHPGSATHHVQVQHLVQEVVDGLVVVRRGPGLIVTPCREPGQPLDGSSTRRIEIIHHAGGNQLEQD